MRPSFLAVWRGLGNGIGAIINPYFHPMTGLLELSGAFLGCMERVWAMELAGRLPSQDYWSFWATWLQVLFGEWKPMEIGW